MDGYGPSTYGDRFADVYDDWYRDITDVEACVEQVEALVARAGGGAVLELGVGSGRLAVPLAERGLDVVGIDASAAMLERLRARPGGGRVRAVLADMAEPWDVPSGPGGGGGGGEERFAVVLAAFNTLFNLSTEAAQRRCLAQAAARLRPGGCVVVEAFVPGDAEETRQTVSRAVEPRHIGLDEVVLTVSEVDHEAQTVTGQHVQLSERGIRLRPWHLRYATPAQLDAMAADAGLGLRWRAGGWAGEPFDDAAGVHVSCYAGPAGVGSPPMAEPGSSPTRR